MSVVQWTTGIQHIGIPTSDIETTIRFYEGLDFRPCTRIRYLQTRQKLHFCSWGT